MKHTRDLEADIRKNRSAVLIVNTLSRKGERSFVRARDLLRREGIEIAASYPVREADRIPELVHDAITRDTS